MPSGFDPKPGPLAPIFYFLDRSLSKRMACSMTSDVVDRVRRFSRLRMIWAFREIMAEICFFPCLRCLSRHLCCRSRSVSRLSFNVANFATSIERFARNEDRRGGWPGDGQGKAINGAVSVLFSANITEFMNCEHCGRPIQHDRNAFVIKPNFSSTVCPLLSTVNAKINSCSKN
jgi:hypothetical protein